MPSVSNLQRGGAGTGTARGQAGDPNLWGGGGDHSGEQGVWQGRLPGGVAEQRLWQVPGKVVGSKLGDGHHTRPRLFCRCP